MLTLFAELSPGAFAILAVVGLTTCMLLVRSQKQMKAATSRNRPGQNAAAKCATEVTAQARQVERWEVRMHEVARELSAQLDSKMVAVELLLREAQEQIARLERLTHGAEAVGMTPEASAGQLDDVSIAAHSGTQAAALPRAVSRPHVLTRNNSRRHQEVYALADAGRSSAEIAQELGTPIGEVELILGLRRPAS